MQIVSYVELCSTNQEDILDNIKNIYLNKITKSFAQNRFSNKIVYHSFRN